MRQKKTILSQTSSSLIKQG